MSGVLGGGGGGTTSTTTVQELSPEQQRLLSLVIPEAEKIIQSPPTLFPGTQIAPTDPLRTQAQEQLLSLAAPGGGLSQDAARAQAASDFLLGPVLFPESNPALRAATDAAIRPLTRSFEQTVLPGIRQEAITAGGFGGTRQGIAEGIASQSLFQQIGDTTAAIQAKSFQESLNALTRGLLIAPQTQQLSFAPIAATEAVGAQRQQVAQQQLSEEVQRFLSEQLIPFSTAQDVAALAFGIPGGSVTSQSTFSGGGGGGLSDILGILGIAATLAAPFLGPAAAGVGAGASLASRATVQF